MRWLFALLLLANVAFLAAMQLQHDKAGTEPMAEHAPLHAEEMRLISDEEAQRQPLAPAPAARTCMEWGQFGDDDLLRVQAALKTLQLGDSNITVRKTQSKSGSYWVYIPPLKSKQEANRKIEELKGMGIEDSFVIQENNKWHFAVSLGLFSSEEGALKYLAQMRAKGVRTAKAAPRNHEAGLTTITISADRANLGADLERLKSDFPGSELKPVKCGS